MDILVDIVSSLLIDVGSLVVDVWVAIFQVCVDVDGRCCVNTIHIQTINVATFSGGKSLKVSRVLVVSCSETIL